MSLHEEARSVYEAHGFSPDGLTELQRIILDDPNYTDEAARTCAYDLLTQEQMRVRRLVTAGPRAPSPRVFPQEEVDQVRSTFVGMFGFPMMDGTPLGSATKEHVMSDAKRYLANAEGNRKQAVFLLSVAKRMKAGQKVSKVWKEQGLASLMDKVRYRKPPETEAGD